MAVIRKDFKYKKIKNLLSQDEVSLLRSYTKIKHRTNKGNFDNKQNNNWDTSFYADPIMESLMLIKKKKIEEVTGLKLHCTYTFWRMYSYNADLKEHKDRPACEISCTVMIGSCGVPWPIYMDGEPIDLEPGDGAVYLGREVKHWRKNFAGDWQSQVFMHYVDAQGPYRNEIVDGRCMFGTQKGDYAF